MKTQRFIIALILVSWMVSATAQQTVTMYWLDNSPMRHWVNPAFQPVSNGYVSLTPLGFINLQAGNNSLSMSDLIYNQNGTTITALHPDADRQKLMNAIRPTLKIEEDIQLNILSFGFRIKEAGYAHFSINTKIDEANYLPHALFDFALNGGMQDLNGGVNNYNLSKLGMNLNAYTEVGIGYSHRINEHWEVGGKLKFLIGMAYAGINMQNLQLSASTNEWNLRGNGQLMVAAPLNFEAISSTIQTIDSAGLSGLYPTSILDYLTPSGYGAAADLGVVWRPIKQLEITAAITDIGFIYWHNARSWSMDANATYNGVGSFEYSDYVVDGKFSTDSLMKDVATNLSNMAKDVHYSEQAQSFVTMPTANVNIGANANFFNRLLGVGIVSNTRLKGNRVSEEVTIGGAVRPCNWFNLALSYSLVDNARYSNFGAGISLMPYDGINLTLAADYIPTSFVAYTLGSDASATTTYIPYRSQGFNISMGLSIVWGTNKKKTAVATR